MSFGSFGQGIEVLETGAVFMSPVAGVVVRKPNVPGSTSAPATPFTTTANPAVTAATMAPDTSSVNIFFLRTMRLALDDGS